MPDVAVRLATEGDAAAVARTLAASFAPLRPMYTPEAFAVTTPDAAALRARWPEGPVWVAIAEGEMAGTVAALERGADVYVRSMGVEPAARGRGVGAALLEAVEGWARARGARALTLSTTPFLHDAIRLYERHGFRRVDGGPLGLHGTPLFTMRKDLA